MKPAVAKRLSLGNRPNLGQFFRRAATRSAVHGAQQSPAEELKELVMNQQMN